VMPRFAAFVAAFVATLSQRGLVAAESLECYDAVPGDEPCYSNLLWAKNTGIKTNPEFYENYSFLDENSPMSHFQYVLWSLTSRSNKGGGWNCTKPCHSTDQMRAAAADKTRKTLPEVQLSTAPSTTIVGTPLTTTTTAVPSSGLSSWPWWGWLLLLLALCCLLALCGGLYWMFAGKKERGPSKKKRSTKKLLPAQTAVPEPSNFTVAPPVYMDSVTTATATPVTTYAPATDARSFVMQPAPAQMMPAPAPVMTAAQPIMMQPEPATAIAQPIMMQAAPALAAQPIMMQPAPAMAMAQPVQQGGSLFDMYDTNHDGSLSRAEFQAMMR